MTDFTRAHELKAEEELGGSPRELAEANMECLNHDFGYYERGPNVGRACKKCGAKKSEVFEDEDIWLSEEELPKDYETFDLEEVEDLRNREFKKEKEYQEARRDDRAKEIAKEEIRTEAQVLTPKSSASSREWKKAFKSASHKGSWEMLRRSYMKSDAWKRRKMKKKEAMDNEGFCAARLPGCAGDFDHVHHKTYDNIGCEPLWDLVPVCHHCHEVIHDRKQPKEAVPTSVSENGNCGQDTSDTELPF